MKHETPPPLVGNARIYIGFMLNAEAVNRQLLADYGPLQANDFLRRSHHFHGRYENLYLARERLPAIVPILAQAQRYAEALLARPEQALRCGFWINDMGPGAVTTEHDHDENDEMLSAVYYVQAPQNAGELVVVEPHSRTLITAQAGMFVFFAPAVIHSVSLNQSGQQRISIGMNFGPALA